MSRISGVTLATALLAAATACTRPEPISAARSTPQPQTALLQEPVDPLKEVVRTSGFPDAAKPNILVVRMAPKVEKDLLDAFAAMTVEAHELGIKPFMEITAEGEPTTGIIPGNVPLGLTYAVKKVTKDGTLPKNILIALKGSPISGSYIGSLFCTGELSGDSTSNFIYICGNYKPGKVPGPGF